MGETCPRSDPDIAHMRYYLGLLKLKYKYSLEASLVHHTGSISCVHYLDRTLGKFPPLYGAQLRKIIRESREDVAPVKYTVKFTGREHLLYILYMLYIFS